MVIVDLALAVICFGSNMECHPVLFGDDTPKGEFRMNLRMTSKVGYGGDVIQFKETESRIYAIHRIWTRNPEQERTKRITEGDLVRRKITKGCINVQPEVYEELKNCCSNEPLVIK